MYAMAATVYLIGAGPGDPDLLTVKAQRLLQQAGVVLYDRLVDPAILDLVPTGSERIFVGKRHGEQSVTQDEINELLVAYADVARTVVRLKGGDPFVFGRGSEEAAYLAAKGVPFEVVPGISSCYAVPELALIPVTERRTASSWGVFSGHAAGRADDADPVIPWEATRHLDTLVFLMAVRSRQAIGRELLRHGRSPREPAAFIERGASPRQRVIVTTLGELAETPPAVESPAILVVGEVVHRRAELLTMARGRA